MGCGGGAAGEPTKNPPPVLKPFDITLDGFEGAENVGVLMAKKRGYFADAGLDVETYAPAGPKRPIRYVVDETVDIGISRQPQVVLARQKGRPIIAVGSVIPRPTAAMIWLKKSGIRDIADLKGKTIAIPGQAFQRDLIRHILERAGLSRGDVKIKRVEFKLVPALLEGEADAIFGGSPNLEGIELRRRGLKPIITPVQRLGIPSYEELVLIVRTDLLSEHPGLIRGFMSALDRGTAAAVEDPKAAVQVIDENIETNVESSRQDMEAQVEATLPMLSESGYMNPGRAADFVAWMREQGWLRRELPVSALLTNSYLPSRP